MRTAAIVGRRTSADRRDRVFFRHDFLFLVRCSPHAALPGHGWRLVCCVSCFAAGYGSGGMKVSLRYEGRAGQSQGTLFFLINETLSDTLRSKAELRQRRVGHQSSGEGRTRDAPKVGSAVLSVLFGKEPWRLARMAGRTARWPWGR